MKIAVMDDFRFEFMKALAKHPDVELSVLTHPQAVEQFEEAGFASSVSALWAKSKLDFGTIRQLRRQLREIQPDLIHAFTSRGLAVALLATTCMRKAPKIVTWRGISRVPSRWDPTNYMSYLHPRIAGYACESDAVRCSLLRSKVAESKCVTTYNCVPSLVSNQSEVERLYSLDLPPGAFVVGTVANVRHVKGIDILLKAAYLCADLPDVHWVVVGDLAKADTDVQRLVCDEQIRDRVHMMGYRRKAHSLMGQFDLFAMPSRSEGLCRALLEAMSQGVCPVVTDAGGMKEAVRHGEDGVVVPTEHPQALANAIRLLYANPALRSTFGHSAAQRINDVFMPEQVIERLVTLYQQVLAGETTKTTAKATKIGKRRFSYEGSRHSPALQS